MIVAPAAGSERSTLPGITRTGTPLVLIDRMLDVDCDQVGPENVTSARMLTEHLLDLGHRRIAVVRGIPGISSTTERFDGYVAALEGRGIGLDPSLVVEGESSTDVAEREVRALLASPNRPTALVSMNNAMTIGTLKAVRSLGLSIPRDVAFVCYDDFEWSDLFEPKLTAQGRTSRPSVPLPPNCCCDAFARRTGRRSASGCRRCSTTAVPADAAERSQTRAKRSPTPILPSVITSR